MGFAIFLIIAQLIVILAHVLLYFSWTHFFHVVNPSYLRTLGIILAVLSFSFLGATLLIFWKDNAVSRFIYHLAAIWLGLLLYLFLAALATWLIILIIRASGIGANTGVVGMILISTALLYSIYGLWNAANPRIKQIEVTIPNLPESWRGRTAVQISDVHLGTIWGRDFMEKITNKIASINPDMVFITGDLFDGEGDDLAREVQPLKEFSPSRGIYFITGNHETYLGVDKAIQALSGISVVFLRDQVVDVDGVQILGIDYPRHDQPKDLNLVLGKLDPQKPNIVLYHSPVHIDQFKRGGVNFQLAGHTHKGQIWPLNYITNRVYGGFDRGLHIDDGYILYTSVGTGTWGPPMRTGNYPEITVINFK